MEFSREEYCSGLLISSPGDLPNPRTEPWSPTLQADSLSLNCGGRAQGNTKGVHQICTGWVEGVAKGCFWRNRHLIYSLGPTAVGMGEKGGKGGKKHLDRAVPMGGRNSIRRLRGIRGWSLVHRRGTQIRQVCNQYNQVNKASTSKDKVFSHKKINCT